jgi:hypothetical protein
MAHVVADRVRETTTTTGTGTYTLAGAVTGFETFGSIGNTNTTYYCCTDGTNFEVGVGTYTSSGTTLARTTILQSSNSDNAVNWSSGTRQIFCTAPAEKSVILDPNNDTTIKSSDGAILKLQTSDTTVVSGNSLGKIEFSAPDEASGTDAVLTTGYINSYARGTYSSTYNGADLIFGTSYSGAAEATMWLENTGTLNIYSNGRGGLPALELNYGTSSSAQGNVIFTNSAGQLCFGMDGSTSNVTFFLDDEDGQPIFTFQEENGTDIMDGGDTDVTVHKPFIVNDDITAKTSDGALLKLQTSDTTVADGNVIGAIEFSAPSEASGTDAITTAASIVAEADATFSSSVNQTDLVFKLGSSEAATEKMRLEHEGNLTVSGTITGTGTSVFADLDISGDVDVDGTLEADAMTLNGTAITTTATLSTGISNNNVPKFTSGVADNDFLRVDGTAIEGRSASEVLSDIGGTTSSDAANEATALAIALG